MSNLVPPSARLVPPSACLVQSTGLMSLKGSHFHCGMMYISAPNRNNASKGCVPVSFPISPFHAVFLSGRVGSCQLKAPFTRLLSQPTFIPRPGSHARRPSHLAQYFVWIGMGSRPISLKPVQIVRHLHNHISNYRGP